MAGSGDNPHAATAEPVVVACALRHGVRRLGAQSAGRVPLGPRLLHEQRRLRKEAHVAYMVAMGVRHGHVLDIGWLEAKVGELARESPGAFPVHRAWIRGLGAVGHSSHGVGHARIPDQPALRMLDEIAVVDERHALAFVDPRRPARDVAGDAFAAVEDVKALHTGRPARGYARAADDRKREQGGGDAGVCGLDATHGNLRWPCEGHFIECRPNMLPSVSYTSEMNPCGPIENLVFS